MSFAIEQFQVYEKLQAPIRREKWYGQPAGSNGGGKPLCLNRGIANDVHATITHQQTQPTVTRATGWILIWISKLARKRHSPIMLHVRLPSPSSFSHIARGWALCRRRSGRVKIFWSLLACMFACLQSLFAAGRTGKKGTETGRGGVVSKDASDFFPSVKKSSRPPIDSN
jgi:hypothetical protein